MPVIASGTMVLEGRICRPGWLETSGARILGCGAGPPPGPVDVDLPDAVVAPGFVDMHVHGGGGASYSDGADIMRAADFHRRHGTTTTLASLVTTSPDRLLTAVQALAEATQAGAIAGIHLEGPWLSAGHCGAHDRNQMRDPQRAEFDALLAAADGAIRMVTLAPELPGSPEAISRFVDAEVVVAVGHTDADYAQTQEAIAPGAMVGTHLFNAMWPLHHREPGPALALLQDSRVTVEVIADGVHLHPAVLHAAIEAAGPGRVALITGATAAAGLGDCAFLLGDVPIDVVAGVARVRGTSTIAGSTATMDQLFRTVVADAGLAAAVQMTSTTPARAFGFDDVGSLRGSKFLRRHQVQILGADDLHQGWPSQADSDLGCPGGRQAARHHRRRVVENQADQQHAQGDAGQEHRIGQTQERGSRGHRPAVTQGGDPAGLPRRPQALLVSRLVVYAHSIVRGGIDKVHVGLEISPRRAAIQVCRGANHNLYESVIVAACVFPV